jgi:hypothetical protein
MILTIILVLATAVGVFLFVKNNPLRAKKIDDAAKKVISEVEQAIKK